jgi:hypothetical protein
MERTFRSRFGQGTKAFIGVQKQRPSRRQTVADVDRTLDPSESFRLKSWLEIEPNQEVGPWLPAGRSQRLLEMRTPARRHKEDRKTGIARETTRRFGGPLKRPFPPHRSNPKSIHRLHPLSTVPHGIRKSHLPNQTDKAFVFNHKPLLREVNLCVGDFRLLASSFQHSRHVLVPPLSAAWPASHWSYDVVPFAKGTETDHRPA